MTVGIFIQVIQCKQKKRWPRQYPPHGMSPLPTEWGWGVISFRKLFAGEVKNFYFGAGERGGEPLDFERKIKIA